MGLFNGIGDFFKSSGGKALSAGLGSLAGGLNGGGGGMSPLAGGLLGSQLFNLLNKNKDEPDPAVQDETFQSIMDRILSMSGERNREPVPMEGQRIGGFPGVPPVPMGGVRIDDSPFPREPFPMMGKRRPGLFGSRKFY